MKELYIGYGNYKGKYSIRNVHPCAVNYETRNIYHGENYIMTCVDKDKDAFRDFCLPDVIKGTIIHTLASIGENYTTAKIEAIYNQLEENYNLQKEK